MDNQWDNTQRRDSAPGAGAWDPSGDWDPYSTGGQSYPAPFGPPPGDIPRGSGGGPRGGPLVALVIAYLVVVALGVGLLTAAAKSSSSATYAASPTGSSGGSPPSSPSSGGQPAACTTAPALQVVGVRGSSSGMVVSLRATSSCSGGQLMSGSWQVRVNSGGTEVAAASFDFSSPPVSIPAGGSAQLQLTFPSGSYRAAPSSLSPSAMTTTGSGSSSGGSGSGSSQASVTADRPLTPASGSIESAAAAALQRQSNADSSAALSQLSGRWSPQLSAKRPGLYADGKTYDNSAILDEYLALKARYPRTLLLWSGDWPVFDSGNFWIVMSGVPFSDPDSANDWCVQENFDKDHCFAKRLSKTGGSDGTTKLRPR